MSTEFIATYIPPTGERGKKINRRDFLRLSGTAAVGATLAACAPRSEGDEPKESLPLPQNTLYNETSTSVAGRSVLGITNEGIAAIRKTFPRPDRFEITTDVGSVEFIIGYGPFFESDNAAIIQLATTELPEEIAAIRISLAEGRQLADKDIPITSSSTIETTITLTREDIQRIVTDTNAAQFIIIPSQSHDFSGSGWGIAGSYANVLVYENELPAWDIATNPHTRTVDHPRVTISMLDINGKTIGSQTEPLNIPNTENKTK